MMRGGSAPEESCRLPVGYQAKGSGSARLVSWHAPASVCTHPRNRSTNSIDCDPANATSVVLMVLPSQQKRRKRQTG